LRNQGTKNGGGGERPIWSFWVTAAVWVLFVLALIGKGVALGFKAADIANGLAIGGAALLLLVGILKYSRRR
jgi:hypothetical protein